MPAAYEAWPAASWNPAFRRCSPAKSPSQNRKLYAFAATQPLRYLAFVVSRFARAETVTIGFADVPKRNDGRRPAAGLSYRSLNLSVEANPRQASRGRDLADRAADIARSISRSSATRPYPSFTLALVESDLPGGHSPAYFAALNQPLPTSQLVWRNDPASFDSFPDFFLAHELAHQWWGQAVGWQNYHEQWLSEGFAQYFAALYAQHQRGDERVRERAAADAPLGHATSPTRARSISATGSATSRATSRVFRALVYNKGAAVLHMLRRLVGDEAFFRGLRRFYSASRFKKAGTDDFRAAMEAEAGRLARALLRAVDLRVDAAAR